MLKKQNPAAWQIRLRDFYEKVEARGVEPLFRQRRFLMCDEMRRILLLTGKNEDER